MGGVLSTIIKFRCSDEEKARWLEQAGERTLTDYFKFLADRDGDGGLVSGDPDKIHVYEVVPVTAVTTTASPSRVSLASIARPTPVGEKRSFKPDFKVPIVKKKAR